MKRSVSLLSLRVGVTALLVWSSSLSGVPAHAQAESSEPEVPPSVIGACAFQGATIEGVAVATFGISTQTGIVCTVYDQSGNLYGACGAVLPATAAACAGPTQLLLGPPVVCTDAFAVFGSSTATYHQCL